MATKTTKKVEAPPFRMVEDENYKSGYAIIWAGGSPIPASLFEGMMYEYYSVELARLRAENIRLRKELEKNALRTDEPA